MLDTVPAVSVSLTKTKANRIYLTCFVQERVCIDGEMVKTIAI